ncbi:hypothetical protein ZWY2020_050195 [Hordeum vulgare]|nr:hypothetical protein ZWY2020_050195 [Hordeum vulgare]
MPFHADDGSLPQLLSSIVAAQKLGVAPSSMPPASATRARFSKPSQRWQCRTRATVVSVYDEAPVTLSFAANMRRLVGARPGYYGKQHSAVVVVIMEVPWKLVVTEQRISSSVETNSSRFLFGIQDKPLDKIYSRLAVAGIHEQNWKWAQHISPTRLCPLVGEDIRFGASHCREFLTFLLREFLTLLHCCSKELGICAKCCTSVKQLVGRCCVGLDRNIPSWADLECYDLSVVMEKRRLRLGKAVYQDLDGEAELDEQAVMEKRRLRLGKAVYQDLDGEAELDEQGDESAKRGT